MCVLCVCCVFVCAVCVGCVRVCARHVVAPPVVALQMLVIDFMF